jgi:hypothetical protein
MISTALNCGWWWPFEGAVVITERPNTLNRDSDGLLHDDDGPSIQYPDGWSIYAWHGVRVPAWIITDPQKITPHGILNERNAEIRRVMIERYGIDRFITDSDAKILDAEEAHGAELVSINLPNDPDEKIVALKLRCPSTSACYVVRVPPDMERAKQALAWTANVEESDYILTNEA